jgi:uncharacterized membrane protein
MSLTCNIDQRGRRARLVTGALVDTVGTALLVAGFVTHDRALLVAGIVVTIAGTFMIFEGAAGWCVVRALGFKTKI